MSIISLERKNRIRITCMARVIVNAIKIGYSKSGPTAMKVTSTVAIKIIYIYEIYFESLIIFYVQSIIEQSNV